MTSNLSDGKHACWWWFFAKHNFVFENWNSIARGDFSHDAQSNGESVSGNITEDDANYKKVY